MPRKELKPAMERVNEIKNKAKNESATATLEFSDWGSGSQTPVIPEKGLTSGLVILQDNGGAVPMPYTQVNNILTDAKGHVTLNSTQMEKLDQNTIRILQEFKDLKERLETIESVLTKLVIHASGNPKPTAQPKEESKELEPYSKAIDEVKTGLKSARTQGNPRIKFEGAGLNIIGVLSRKGFNIPNTEEFKAALRSTPGFTYSSVDNTFSYEGE